MGSAFVNPQAQRGVPYRGAQAYQQQQQQQQFVPQAPASNPWQGMQNNQPQMAWAHQIAQSMTGGGGMGGGIGKNGGGGQGVRAAHPPLQLPAPVVAPVAPVAPAPVQDFPAYSFNPSDGA